MSFRFNFTKEHLSEMLNGNPASDEWYDAMAEVLPKYEITTEERVAGFVAQCAHESGNFLRLEENLNYSAEALEKVFGRYFGEGKRNAAEYARQPEKIANYIYMDEFRSAKGALGNTQPGDGWRFRGRGLKQLTGRNNYTTFGKNIGMTAEEAAEYVATKQGALESACWFWKRANCNDFADVRDIEGMSRRINGGTIGLEDRVNRWDRALELFEVANKAPADIEILYETVRVGSKGNTVSAVQRALGIASDGVFGPMTERAVKAWQAANDLTADGIIGPKSIARLFGK